MAKTLSSLPHTTARYQLPKHFSTLDVPMMLLSILSVIGAFCLAFLNLAPETKRILLYVDTLICTLFLSHWSIGLFCSQDKGEFIRLYWIDFFASIPAVEPLRVARIFQVLRVIRVLRSSHFLLRSIWIRRELTLSTLIVMMFIVLSVSSVIILLLEAHFDGSNIKTAEQAIWWSLVTISTVGYGDYYPVTTLGKVFGGCVILCGVSFFGVLSGYMASWFTQPSSQDQLLAQQQSEQLQELQKQQDELLHQIKILKKHLVDQPEV
tara:strand:- start:15710 stop:16504 length:795 start_codon:yes stop_codon:yes gene_type:complete